ncbi:hypothetical protein ACRALDRAFT_1072795 [Sodiomyces alcalophilus JCM 7366]|uniref:uncharacterized protein n=1 Tax=Sodiomyces alcalophilus JCM 7366 TaxID=591952 RepID=UPI0039B5F49B
MAGNTYCKKHEICAVPGCHVTPDTHPDARHKFVCPKHTPSPKDDRGPTYEEFYGLGRYPSPHMVDYSHLPDKEQSDVDQDPIPYRRRQNDKDSFVTYKHKDDPEGSAASSNRRRNLAENDPPPHGRRSEASLRRLREQRQNVRKRRDQRDTRNSTQKTHRESSADSQPPTRISSRSPSPTPSLLGVRERTMRGANQVMPAKKGEENAKREELKKKEEELKKKEEELEKKEEMLKKKETEEKRRQEVFIQAAREELAKVQDKECVVLRNQLADSIITQREFRERQAKLRQKHNAHMLELEDELRWRFANEEGFDPYLAVASNEGK